MFRGLRFTGMRFAHTSATGGKGGMKKLIKEYGWTATGIYLFLSAVDLPITFMFVHSLGQKRLEDWEIKCREMVGLNSEREKLLIHKAASGGKSLWWTELGIAYIIHKSLLVFVRVPITVAITPKVANKLGQWGFNVKRAMPTVDKQQLAEKVIQAGKDSQMKAVKKATEKVGKKLN